MGLKSTNRGKIEKVILLIVFLGALVFVAVTYMRECKVAKEKALYSQLAAMRQGIGLYGVLEKSFPKSLIELAYATYRMPGDSMNRKYVEMVQVGKDGKIVDPFGTPYYYDPKTGWINSATPGFKDW